MGSVNLRGRATHRNDLKTQDLVVMWENQRLSLAAIGKLVGLTRQAVKKRLNKAGVSTAKSKRWILPCALCGVPVARTRNKLRHSKGNVFCTSEHLHAWMENPNFREWRQGGRLARAIVAQHFELQPEHIVHHKDGDQRNNDRANLLVFASSSDHGKHHHGRKVEALWDGVLPK